VEKPDPLKPDVALISKIGSIIVHVDELLSTDGRNVDKLALQVLIQDSSVQRWLKDLGPLVPVKRGAVRGN